MRTSILIVLLLVPLALFALDTDAMDRADVLYDDDKPQEAIAILNGVLGTAGNGPERAEVLWRLSRATLGIGEDLEDADAPLHDVLTTYERGEQYGKDAVAADPTNNLGYYWQSSNIGKWGQAKGILDSLFKAGPMRDLLKQSITLAPDHPASYYVLGQLYEQVPGLISFGNVNYSVSLGRKSIDLHEAEMRSGKEDEMEYDYYIQLASHLIKRNWNESKRDREQANKRRQFDRARDVLERGWYYEGTVRIPAMSDREEAEQLLRDMIRRMEALPDITDGQRNDLEHAHELLDSL